MCKNFYYAICLKLQTAKIANNQLFLMFESTKYDIYETVYFIFKFARGTVNGVRF